MEEDIADSKVENICDIYIPTFYLIDLHSIIHRFLKFSLFCRNKDLIIMALSHQDVYASRVIRSTATNSLRHVADLLSRNRFGAASLISKSSVSCGF